MSKTKTWVKRWGYEVAEKATKPGVFELKTGGYLVRGRVTNPVDGRRFEVMRVLHGEKLREAVEALTNEMARARARLQQKTPSKILFAEFAAQLLEEKVLRNKLASAATREWWEVTLRIYLIPEFGRLTMRGMERQHVDAFITKQAGWIMNGKPSARIDKRTGKPQDKTVPYKPRTANAHLRILRTILNAATDRLDIPKNPFKGVEFHPEARAYTREAPNRVRGIDLPKFLETARLRYPQYYAMVVLGFLLGIRPSHMRPLRRQGAEADVKWSEGILLIRRSNTRTGVVMDRTKTNEDQEVALPGAMMEILLEHVARLPMDTEKQRASDLLFPTKQGGMRARTCLDKPFKALSAEVGYKVTPRAMRRTFNNAARASGVHDVVTRSISGHQTEDMQRHYSFAEFEEQRAELGRILDSMLGGATREERPTPPALPSSTAGVDAGVGSRICENASEVNS